jgi:hypothetical protein
VGDNQSENALAWEESSSNRYEHKLMLNYPEPVNISQIVARETFNAGSIAVLDDAHCSVVSVNVMVSSAPV